MFLSWSACATCFDVQQIVVGGGGGATNVVCFCRWCCFVSHSLRWLWLWNPHQHRWQQSHAATSSHGCTQCFRTPFCNVSRVRVALTRSRCACFLSHLHVYSLSGNQLRREAAHQLCKLVKRPGHFDGLVSMTLGDVPLPVMELLGFTAATSVSIAPPSEIGREQLHLADLMFATEAMLSNDTVTALR